VLLKSLGQDHFLLILEIWFLDLGWSQCYYYSWRQLLACSISKPFSNHNIPEVGIVSIILSLSEMRGVIMRRRKDICLWQNDGINMQNAFTMRNKHIQN
jgi:hypothetical protein